MFPINSKAVFGIWCAMILCSSAQADSRTLSERSNVETAAQRREPNKKNNRGGPPRPASAELAAVDERMLKNLGAEDLAKLSLEDPLLKYAYVSVFMRSYGAFEQLDPFLELVLADMRRRGEEVSPVLLKLMADNYDNSIEFFILLRIGHLDTVRIEPFLEYARKLLRERAQTMTDYAASGALYILGRHGTKEDEALLEWVLKERPYVAHDVTSALSDLRARLGLKDKPSPERGEIPSSNTDNHVRKDQHKEFFPLSLTKPWIIGGSILLVLLGVYRLLRKRRTAL